MLLCLVDGPLVLCAASVDAYLLVCGEVNFQDGVGEDDGADVASLYDGEPIGGDCLSLDGQKKGAYCVEAADLAYVLLYLGCVEVLGDVFAVNVDVLLVVVPANGDVALFEEVGDVFFVQGRGLFCIRRAVLQKPVGECAVECACGEGDAAQALCEDAGDGGFPCACLAVNSDDLGLGRIGFWVHGLGFVGRSRLEGRGL